MSLPYCILLYLEHSYEYGYRLYYQYQSDRLPFCTLPVHSLLHLPNYIIDSGPLWTVWSYPTERLCGFIVQLSKSKKNPYASFARRLREIAQLNQIKLLYSLHNELDLSTETSDRRRGLHLNGDRTSIHDLFS